MISCWNKEKSTNRKDNRVYYINLESGISQWGIPANNLLLPSGWEMNLSKSQNVHFYSNFKKKISQWNMPSKKDANKIPDGWEEMRSLNCKSIYYKNSKTGEVQWIIPDDLSIKPVGIGIPTSFLHIVEDCSKNNIWKKTDQLGFGTAGSIYIACKAINDCEYAIKIQKQNKEYYTEIDALLSLQHTNAVPKVFAAWTCEDFGYFVMEKLYPCTHNDNFMWKEVGKKLNIIQDAGYLHLDIHKGNVMCNKDGQVVLIDFGYAVKRTEQGNKQEYPDNIVSQSYGISLTWEYLKLIEENMYNINFNPAFTSPYSKSITEEQKRADEKCTKNNDALKKLEQKIPKQIIPPRLQVHLDYQNGKFKDYPTWENAKDEISIGKKEKHWIWYVFPSFLPVRGHSKPDLILKDLDEVKAYIANDLLRNRLVEITNIAAKQLNKQINANVLFGSKLDALKFWECITLFFLASNNGSHLDLYEVCDKALSALNPYAVGQDRLEPNTVIAFIQAEGEILEQKRHNQSVKKSIQKVS